jgi:hypothetical protein
MNYITPGSITFIPDLDYAATGAITLSSSVAFSFESTYDTDFLWGVEGEAAKDLESSWNVGSGEYYWYRVEGTCEKISCDNLGVRYEGCRGTFLNTVAARNLSELCDKLKAPSNNPPVVVKINSIKKYSRPVLRAAGEPECNTLDDQDFCQVLECADYCLSEIVVERIAIQMKVVDYIREHLPQGGLSLGGYSELDRRRIYEPPGSEVSVYGGAVSSFRPCFYPSGSVALSSRVKFALSHYEFPFVGTLAVGGFSRFVSPSWNYRFSGGFEVDAPIDVLRTFSSTLQVEMSGSCVFFVNRRFRSSGSVEVLGVIAGARSPSFNYSPSGSIFLEGGIDIQDLGTIIVNSALVASVFDITSDINELEYSSTLTISDQTISPSCGCGPIGLALPLSHNLGNSLILSNFLKSNASTLASSISMAYKSNDKSWRSVQHLSGRGRDGVSLEDWSVFFSLTCLTDIWQLAFLARAYNRLQDEDVCTKLILNMPADAICSDNKIATDIRVNINSGELVVAKGKQISVVSPARPVAVKTRGVSVTVDGIFNDYVIYYDNLGLFKDSYWSSVPFEIKIDPAIRLDMPTMDLNPIFR